MKRFRILVRRDLALAGRRGGGAVLAPGFFIVTASLYPFGVGPDPEILGRIAAGIVWTTALLAAIISLEGMFRPDLEDGSLDLLAVSPMPLEMVVAAKCLVHWLTTGFPVTLLAPLMALLLRLDEAAFVPLVVSLAIGTPVLSLTGAIGAALVLGARRGGALTGLLVLPLFVPVLVFGIAVTEAALASQPVLPHILVEAALLVVGLPLGILAGAAGLRLAIEGR